jgi:hypothetical protein
MNAPRNLFDDKCTFQAQVGAWGFDLRTRGFDDERGEIAAKATTVYSRLLPWSEGESMTNDDFKEFRLFLDFARQNRERAVAARREYLAAFALLPAVDEWRIPSKRLGDGSNKEAAVFLHRGRVYKIYHTSAQHRAITPVEEIDRRMIAAARYQGDKHFEQMIGASFDAGDEGDMQIGVYDYVRGQPLHGLPQASTVESWAKRMQLEYDTGLFDRNTLNIIVDYAGKEIHIDLTPTLGNEAVFTRAIDPITSAPSQSSLAQ